jgi:DNA-binding IclR family transcriptional regulator
MWNTQANGSSIKILEKTFGVLAAFTADQPAWSLTGLSVALRLPKSTVHRILAVLGSHRYVVRDGETGRFRLGPAALELGRRARVGTDLREVALPVLRRIARECGETVFLLVPNQTRDRAVCIERVESPLGLRLIAEIGAQVPLNAGASAKALLAYMSPEEIERIIAQGLPPLGPGTITSAAALRRDLERTRRRGYASSREETDAGATGIGVPVFGASGEVVASLAIAGPLTRFTRARRAHCAALALSASREIAAMLGGAAAGASGANLTRRGRRP